MVKWNLAVIFASNSDTNTKKAKERKKSLKSKEKNFAKQIITGLLVVLALCFSLEVFAINHFSRLVWPCATHVYDETIHTKVPKTNIGISGI